MKAYERRERGAYPFFKLAVWDERNCVWKAGKVLFETEVRARASARKPGRYRLTRFEDGGSKSESEPFTVPA